MRNVFMTNQFDTYVLNVGMLDNLLTIDEIVTYLKLSSNFINVKKAVGEWKGQKEKTFVIVLGTSIRYDSFSKVLETLCLISNQFCIAYKSNANAIDKTKFIGNLSFNPSLYKSDIKNITFDNELFINY
jgi:hypothetical protein